MPAARDKPPIAGEVPAGKHLLGRLRRCIRIGYELPIVGGEIVCPRPLAGTDRKVVPEVRMHGEILEGDPGIGVDEQTEVAFARGIAPSSMR